MSKTSTILSLLLLLFGAGPLLAQESWVQQATFTGTARYNAASFVLNNAAYMGTGKSSTSAHNDF